MNFASGGGGQTTGGFGCTTSAVRGAGVGCTVGPVGVVAHAGHMIAKMPTRTQLVPEVLSDSNFLSLVNTKLVVTPFRSFRSGFETLLALE
jgi:hypothetical protein